jgi:hypothetical protein
VKGISTLISATALPPIHLAVVPKFYQVHARASRRRDFRISAIGKVPSAWAQDELRSVNGQVEYLLRQAVQKRKGGTGTPFPNPAEPDKSL